MFFKPSASRVRLGQWVYEMLDWLTFPSSDRDYLDKITTSEILDATYLEGTEISEAIVAHALFLPEVEQDEAQRGLGANSIMEVSFPIKVESEQWGYDIQLRFARPSVVGIGSGEQFPRVNLNPLPPKAMLQPRIQGTQYQLQETSGDRLRTLAGPVKLETHRMTGTIDEPSNSHKKTIRLPGEQIILAYRQGQTLVKEEGQHGLQPLSPPPSLKKILSLQMQRSRCELELEVRWISRQPQEARLVVRVKVLPRSEGEELNERDKVLSALVLPHLLITLNGATADFPPQQYAETKQHFLQLSEEEAHQVAQERLYSVRQSGCIATRNPNDPTQVALTTFGIFDTPREPAIPGPAIKTVTASPAAFLSQFPGHSEASAEFVNRYWHTLRGIVAAANAAFGLQQFHQFQWEAITTGIELEATGRTRVTTIVRAPTGAGKTIVFMVNAAVSSLCGEQRSTSVLLFPTRLLNEDMFRRLTVFVYQLRQELPERNVTGGLAVGDSDLGFKLLLKPNPGEVMPLYGRCPVCSHPQLIAAVPEEGRNPLPSCPSCGHRVSYMFNPTKEVTTYLPDLVIATPDKLFVEATVQPYEGKHYGFFGAAVRRCNQCNRTHSALVLDLKNKTQCHQVFSEAHCSGVFSKAEEVKPIRYMGFDEVHNLHGQTVTNLSVFLATLEGMQRLLSNQHNLSIRYETATATIANEEELLRAITRRSADENQIISIPKDDETQNYFTIKQDQIRHRVLLTMPTRTNSRLVLSRSLLNAYDHLRGQHQDLKRDLQSVCEEPNAWDFIVGYVYKLQDGLDFRRALIDFYGNPSGKTLNIAFLSGRTPQNQISEIINKASKGEIDILLANLVMSLGVDLHDLNHMIMFGVPNSFTEYVQMAGRTGRRKVSGHVNIILLPHYARDSYLYRHFHAVFSDVKGYYDSLPVRSSNLHYSKEIFFNVARSILVSFCFQQRKWSHRRGVMDVVQNREAAIIAALARLLCDEPTLLPETHDLAKREYAILKNLLNQNDDFLGALLLKRGLLLRSLRGRNNKTVQVNCIDHDLQALITSGSGANLEDSEN